MPPRRKTAPSLSSHICSLIKENIIRFLDNHILKCDYCSCNLESECTTISKARYVFSTSLSNNLKNQILASIRYEDFPSYVSQVVKSSSLRVLMNNSFQAITVFSCSELETAAELNRNLKCIRIRMDDALFFESVPELSQIITTKCEFLTKLCFGESEIDTRMLAIVGRNCQNLEHLSAALCDKLKPKELMSFCFGDYPENTKLNQCCNNIKTLEIPTVVDFSTSLKYDNGEAKESCICNFFSYFPNLRALYYLRAGHVILHLLAIGKSLSANLTYFQDLKPTPAVLKAVSIVCKNIEHLNLLRIDQASLDCIRDFQNLTYLELSLTKCRGVSSILAKVGRKLQILKVIMGEHLAVTSIARYCQNLSSLTIGAGSTYSFETKLAFPKCLEFFEIVQRWESVDGTKMHHLIACMPGLLHLKLWFGIVDNDLKMLLSSGSIKNLRTFRIVKSTAVSLKTLHDVVYSSPNLLEIGDLRSFEVSDLEKDEFIEKLNKENVGVKIIN